MNQTIGALGALAQESRLAAFRLLVEAGPGGLPAGVLADRLGVAPPTLSFHLAQLARAGLVASRRHGRSIVYVADYAAMDELLAYLTENCCRGSAGCAAPDRDALPSGTDTGESDHETPARARRR